jgi:hypothetical protein
MATDKIQLKYEISRAASIEACRMQSSLWPSAAGGATAFAISAIATVLDRADSVTNSQYANSILLCLVVGMLFFVVLALINWFVIIPIDAGRFHRQNPLWFGDVELAQDQDGIEFRTSRSTTRHPWSDFRGFKENGKTFLICLSKSVAYPIPKKGLSPEIIEDMRQQWVQRLTQLR